MVVSNNFPVVKLGEVVEKKFVVSAVAVLFIELVVSNVPPVVKLGKVVKKLLVVSSSGV